MSRFHARLRIFSKALAAMPMKPWRKRPENVQRVLIAHRLLLGDTLLLTPLLKKLRQRYPQADIVLTCPPNTDTLFACAPYGVRVLTFNPRRLADVEAILASGPYDLAIIAGDLRYSWLALAAGSRWNLAYAAQAPRWKRWPIDEVRAFPASPTGWADALAALIDGPAPGAFSPIDWPMPAPRAFSKPKGPYAVLHPGASAKVKQWVPQRWMTLALWLSERGIMPVWSGGPGEAALVKTIDPEGRFHSYAALVDLPQLASLLCGARVLVCPDTGVAHLGRIVGVPTLALFGPGNAGIHGAGAFWEDSPFVAETVAAMACRNQHELFEMRVDWIRRCDRDLASCINRRGDGAACMFDISENTVEFHLEQLIRGV